ncbi:hypothetical protein D3C77_614180 [compost metagenome]
MVRLPATWSVLCCRLRLAFSTVARIRCAWRRNWWPWWVSDMPLAWRLNRLTPISSSSCWMARVRVDWEMNTAWAAAEMEPVSATAMKWRIWRRVIMGRFAAGD